MQYFFDSNRLTNNGKMTRNELATRMLRAYVKACKKYSSSRYGTDKLYKRAYKALSDFRKGKVRKEVPAKHCKFVSECREFKSTEQVDFKWDMMLRDAMVDQDTDRATRIPSAFMAATMRQVGSIGAAHDSLEFVPVNEPKLMLALGWAPQQPAECLASPILLKGPEVIDLTRD